MSSYIILCFLYNQANDYAKLSPSCEPKELIARQSKHSHIRKPLFPLQKLIALGFQTNKYGLVYTLNNMEPMQSASDVDTPSILYLNNPLEDCTINSIKVEMEMHSRTAQQVAWSRWGPSLFAAISCSITNDQGSLRFNITAEYELVSPNAVKQAYKSEETSWSKAAAQNMFQFLKSNNVLDPAMWWAESLMSYSWVIAAQQMEVWNGELDTHAQKGTISTYSEPFLSISIHNHLPRTLLLIADSRFLALRLGEEHILSVVLQRRSLLSIGHQ